MEKLKEIIRSNRMSTRPEFYSGRGATISDLNSEILEGIFRGIEKEFGQKAADSYVKMVNGIKVISATTFLNELYSLFYNNWKYNSKKKDESGVAIQKDKNGEYSEVHGMISIFNAMGNSRDDSRQIKGRFLMQHGICQKRTADSSGYYYYHHY